MIATFISNVNKNIEKNLEIDFYLLDVTIVDSIYSSNKLIIWLILNERRL